jgi:hypothetical protein
MIPFGLGGVAKFIGGRVERAGRDFMQQWFPDMRQVAIDQRYASAPCFSQGITEFGCQFEATRAASDDNDTMRR